MSGMFNEPKGHVEVISPSLEVKRLREIVENQRKHIAEMLKISAKDIDSRDATRLDVVKASDMSKLLKRSAKYKLSTRIDTLFMSNGSTIVQIDGFSTIGGSVWADITIKSTHFVSIPAIPDILSDIFDVAPTHVVFDIRSNPMKSGVETTGSGRKLKTHNVSFAIELSSKSIPK